MSNPSATWQSLQAGHRRFSATLRSRQGPAATNRSPVAAVFRCADSDIASEVLLDQRRGSLIDVSTWGHAVDISVLATLEYAVGTLNTPLIVVVGHSDCAAMHTALKSWNNVAFPEGSARAVVEQAVSSLTRLDANIADADELSAAHVVQTGVTLLHKSPIIAKAVDDGQTAIVCLAGDRTDGRLRVCATLGAVSETESPLLERV